MKRIVRSVFRGKDFLYVKFIMLSSEGDYMGMALADPQKADLLRPGLEVDLVWSRDAGAYVVQF